MFMTSVWTMDTIGGKLQQAVNYPNEDKTDTLR